MNPAKLLRAALLAGAALIAVVVVTGGEDPYTLKLRMANAGGLKDGSPVAIGGVRIGKVDVDVDPKGQAAVVSMKIDDQYAPLGRDTTATIVAQNLLGQKQVQLTKGSGSDPAPDGFVIPNQRLTEATDLDRVLSVLDADTRTRLAIFVNETGTAFTGRKADFNRFLRDIAPAIRSGNDVLGQLAADNKELGSLVETSDRYVAEVTRRRADVVRFIDRVGEAATTGATKRAELRRTLAQAPGSLRTLRTFLAELRATTVPLGPAARELSNASGPLRTALAEFEPFRQAATPALRTATSVAPTLERLALKATPVLRQAVPTAAAARKLGVEALPPVLDVTDKSINNTLAVVDNWTGAIQFRDGLSHVFRGEASFAPDALASVLERLAPKPKRTRRRGGGRRPATGATPSSGSQPSGAGPSTPKLPKLPTITLPGLPPIQVPDVGAALDGVLEGVTGPLTGGGRNGSSDERMQDASALLDYLLG